MIDYAWLKQWKESYYPKITYVVQSWYTPLNDGLPVDETGDLSACVTLGVFRTNNASSIILLSLLHEKLDAFSLCTKAKHLCQDYLYHEGAPFHPNAVPDIVLFEDKDLGVKNNFIPHSLSEAGVPILRFNPLIYGNSLIDRTNCLITFMQQGNVFLCKKPYIKGLCEGLREADQYLLNHLVAFPDTESYSIVSGIVQAVLYLKEVGLLNLHSGKRYDKDAEKIHTSFY